MITGVGFHILLVLSALVFLVFIDQHFQPGNRRTAVLGIADDRIRSKPADQFGRMIVSAHQLLLSFRFKFHAYPHLARDDALSNVLATEYSAIFALGVT